MEKAEAAFAVSAFAGGLFPFAGGAPRPRSAPGVDTGAARPESRDLVLRRSGTATTQLTWTGKARCPLGMATNLWQSSGRWPMAATAGSMVTLLACSEPSTPRRADVWGLDSRESWSSELKLGRLMRCQSAELEPSLADLLAQSVVRSGLQEVDKDMDTLDAHSSLASSTNPPRASSSALRAGLYLPSPDASPKTVQRSPDCSRSTGSQWKPDFEDEWRPQRVLPGNPLASPDVSPAGTPWVSSENSPKGNEFEDLPSPYSPCSPGPLKLTSPGGTPWKVTGNVEETAGRGLARSLSTDLDSVVETDSVASWSSQVLRTLFLEAPRLQHTTEPRPGIRSVSTADIAKTFGLRPAKSPSQLSGLQKQSSADLESTGASPLSASVSEGQFQSSPTSAVPPKAAWGLERNAARSQTDHEQGTASKHPVVPGLNFAKVRMGDDEEDEEDFENKVGNETVGVASTLPRPSSEQQKERKSALGVPRLELAAVSPGGGAGAGETSKTQIKASASAVELRNVHAEQQVGLLPPAVPSMTSPVTSSIGTKSQAPRHHALSMYINDQTLMMFGRRGGSSQQPRKKLSNEGSGAAVRLPPLQQKQWQMQKLQKPSRDKRKGTAVVHAHIHHHYHVFSSPGLAESDNMREDAAAVMAC